MKRILFLMTFVLPLLFSCSKEEMQVKDEQKTGQVYTIYASFDDGETKTTLGPGNKPLWVAKDDAQGIDGDRIWLSNGEVSSSGTVVSVENNVAKIETSLDLSGKTIYAVYPYTADEDCSVVSGSIRFKIPSTQDGTFAMANICAAKSTDGKLHFKNVTSLFKVSAKAAAVDKFVFTKDYIAGEFEAVFGNDGIQEVSLVSGQGSITVTKPKSDSDGMYFIAVSPNLIYGGGAEMGKFYNGSTVYCTKTAKASGIKTERNKIFNLGVTNIDNALNGTFTVNNSGKKVMFSKGNLYHDNGGFKFETNQTDVATSWDPTHVSHFFHVPYKGVWRPDFGIDDSYAKEFNHTYGGDDDFAKDDKFLFTNSGATSKHNEFSVAGQKGQWRALSGEEFDYLLNKRKVNGGEGEGKSYVFTTLGGTTKGLIIFKDDYTGTTTGFTAIPSGCVFLPFSGYRNVDSFNDTANGYYWCGDACEITGWSYAGSEYANCFILKNNDITWCDDEEGNYRSWGMCIRLVADF